MTNRLTPALLGGLFIGILSSLPVVMVGNCCCCLWVVCGGMLTAYLKQGAQEAPLETQEAVLASLLAGIVGALTAFMIGVVLWTVFGSYQEWFIRWLVERMRTMPNMPPEALAQLESMEVQEMTWASQLFQLVVTIPVYMVFSMLGALLGLALFRKKTPAAAPQA